LAILMGAFLINGLQPGAALMTENPTLVWGIIASLFIGNAILLIMNLPLVGVWVKILQVPYHILFPLILVFMLVGSYSINRSMFDIWVLIGFGIFGYLAKLLDFPLVPITLTVILGPILEKSLRQSLQMSGGSLGILFRSPASTTFILLAGLIGLAPVVLMIYRKIRKIDKGSVLKIISEQE